jgi:hypothetical protein
LFIGRLGATNANGPKQPLGPTAANGRMEPILLKNSFLIDA